MVFETREQNLAMVFGTLAQFVSSLTSTPQNRWTKHILINRLWMVVGQQKKNNIDICVVLLNGAEGGGSEEEVLFSENSIQ